MSATNEPATYATYPTFLGLRNATREAAFTIAGVPLDLGTTNRSGTRFGPAAIRVASRMLVDGAHPDSGFDPRTLDLADIGDFQPVIGDIAASHRQIEAAAHGLNHLIALGGDHSMTLPLMRARARGPGRSGWSISMPTSIRGRTISVRVWPMARRSTTVSRRGWSTPSGTSF